MFYRSIWALILSLSNKKVENQSIEKFHLIYPISVSFISTSLESMDYTIYCILVSPFKTIAKHPIYTRISSVLVRYQYPILTTLISLLFVQYPQLTTIAAAVGFYYMQPTIQAKYCPATIFGFNTDNAFFILYWLVAGMLFGVGFYLRRRILFVYYSFC